VSHTALDPRTALALLVRQLETSQWSCAGDLAAAQFRHLVALAEHCRYESPTFAARLANAGLAPRDLGSPDGLARLPPVTRRDLQAAGDALFCRRVPAGHGEVSETSSSGSTGEPVVVRRSRVNALFWNALTMRELRWHGRDLAGRLCAITPNVSEPQAHEDWGAPAALFARTGAMLALPIGADAARLATWLVDFQPGFLVVFPSTLNALANHCRYANVALPCLRHILTVGETLSPAVRSTGEATFQVPVADSYSCEETGLIACSCPSGGYHVMSESVIAEVLNERGEQCKPGEAGRVVVTALHNYATPLVRYALGDVVEVAAPCGCGRGLPTWTRIMGRERNLVHMPDGTRVWPLTGFFRCRDVAPVVQYQFIQRRLDAIEVRLVVERPLSAREEDRLRHLFHEWIRYRFHTTFVYFPTRLPASPSGKFEEFRCELQG
jgi:phenylacetate-CoA ligase